MNKSLILTVLNACTAPLTALQPFDVPAYACSVAPCLQALLISHNKMIAYLNYLTENLKTVDDLNFSPASIVHCGNSGILGVLG